MLKRATRAVDYAGRTAVVTGAASGIGRALAVALAGRGANLAISDVDTDGLAVTKRSCESHGVRVRTYHLDVADRRAVLAHAEQVASDLGKVNLVVNNAGVAVAGTIAETTFEDLDWLLAINLGGVINGTKAFLPHLIASGEGHLVNLSSVFGLIAPAYNGIYAASKFAVRALTEALRQEMAISGYRVTVHAVHPGGIRTNIARSARVHPSAKEAASSDDLAREFERVARTSPERAAARILDGVDRDQARILVGPDAWLIAAAERLVGARYVDVLGRVGRRAIARAARRG